jgi:hypothetical protein
VIILKERNKIRVPQTTEFAFPLNSGFLITLTPTYPFRGRI